MPPKVTAVAPSRWVPLMVTTVPPVVVPVAGVNVVMVGAGVTYLYLVADVTEPPGVVTLMVTVPAVSAGVLTTIFVAASDVTVAALPPKVTAVAPLRWVPLMVTTVPPVVEPVAGANVVIVGAGVTNLNLVADVTVPPGVVTLMVTVPAASALVVALICGRPCEDVWWPLLSHRT